MRKLFTFSLLLAVCLAAFAGCRDNDTNIYTEASYDSVSEFVPESVSREENESGNPLTGGFVVKEKKYTFDGNDLVVISVENNTNKNYTLRLPANTLIQTVI